MADQDPAVRISLRGGIGPIERAAWDKLAGDHPFVGHDFLSALEDSHSVGPGTGWSPAPILAEDGDGRLLAAAPAYLKSHSQGEYVFDHGWADAFEQAGGRYYPKLLIAAPFTPVPGPRLLGPQPALIVQAAEALVDQNGLSSAHATFLHPRDVDICAKHGWLIRHGIQYHWANRGYADFDAFLAALSSRKRKAIRKERAAARAGLTFRTAQGRAISSADLDWMWRFYQDTGARKWGRPYLTRSFFSLAVERMGDELLLFLAERDGQPIAGALNVVGPDTLYGRYWGAVEDVPYLHFELCYYQAIEWACRHGLKSVQAGAQGEHKLARGYEPVTTFSAHYLAHPGLRDAVARFLEEERLAVAREMAALAAALPYRASSGSE